MFKERDIIFLGDSLTANGLWVAEVYQFLRKKMPIKAFNCGVSGGMASYAEHYLNSKCLIYNPTVVSIMYGINDIKRWVLSKTHPDCSNADKIIKEAIDEHEQAYEAIIKKIQDTGARVIICFPPPYDESSENDTENLFCNGYLSDAIERQKNLAERYNCTVVDFNSFFTKISAEIPEVMTNDRVHPSNLGQHILAQVYLKTLGYIDEADVRSEFVFEEWNEKRYLAEREYKTVEYVEYCDIFPIGWLKRATMDQKKAIVRERLELRADKNDAISGFYKDYLEKIDYLEQLISEMLKLTVY